MNWSYSQSWLLQWELLVMSDSLVFKWLLRIDEFL